MPLPFPVRGISVRFSVGVRNSLQAYSTVSGEGIWVNNCLENFFFSHFKSAIYSPCTKQLLSKDNTISEREYLAPMPRRPSCWSINPKVARGNKNELKRLINQALNVLRTSPKRCNLPFKIKT